MEICFDSDKYEQLQSQKILERVKQFDGKLYLEFGGKLFDDLHASRVLPGFRPDSKLRILQQLSEHCEIIMTVSSKAIERRKVRADYGLTYDEEVIRQIKKLRQMGLMVSSVVVTMFEGQKSAEKFIQRLKNMGEKVYIHRPTKGYPDDVDTIASDEGYGANPYIKTTKPIVVVTAPGPNSGKMATCLSQLYHESKKGKRSGYAKFETFPIWNLPVDHPVNLAYEAATADINDKNMVDTFHLKVYGERVTNYNRDIESFPILSKLLAKITGNSKIYQSPTDMGVNMAGYAIFNDGVARKSAQNEIIRRYYRALCDAKQGAEPIVTSERIARLMKKHGIDTSSRKVIAMAKKSYENSGRASVAIELDGGRVVCGKTTDLLTCASSAVLNSLKVLAGIEDGVYLLGQNVLEPVCEFKRKIYGDKCVRLNLYDVLSSLALSARTDHLAERAFSKLSALAYAEAHSSHILDSTDLSMLKSLKVNISSEPEYFAN